MVDAASAAKNSGAAEVIRKAKTRIDVVPVPELRLRVVANTKSHRHARRHTKIALKKAAPCARGSSTGVALIHAVLQRPSGDVVVKAAERESAVEVFPRIGFLDLVRAFEAGFVARFPRPYTISRLATSISRSLPRLAFGEPPPSECVGHDDMRSGINGKGILRFARDSETGFVADPWRQDGRFLNLEVVFVPCF